VQAGLFLPMRSVARHQASDFQILTATSHEDFAVARELFEEYARELGVDLCFQNFASELHQLAVMYAAPEGRLLLAKGNGEFRGCVGVRRLSEDACEMKRLYVRAAARRSGLGRRLAEAAIQAARELGYRRMLLDTLETMHSAQILYRGLGFKEVAPYYPNPLPQVTYMSLDL
jgi:ribosomal protein S18 acetylase RimI-like enzyme